MSNDTTNYDDLPPVPDTFKHVGETEEQWLNRILGVSVGPSDTLSDDELDEIRLDYTDRNTMICDTISAMRAAIIADRALRIDPRGSDFRPGWGVREMSFNINGAKVTVRTSEFVGSFTVDVE